MSHDMSHDNSLPESSASPLPVLAEISDAIEDLAAQRQGDCLALLELLRTLEYLHQNIRETLFTEALPANRQHLYQLLRDIEVNGGWPYIKRMKLTALLKVWDEQMQGSLPLD
jgi:hypothetical protein